MPIDLLPRTNTDPLPGHDRPLRQTSLAAAPDRRHNPRSKLNVISNPFYEGRILIIKLFALTDSETTKRKLYQPLAYISAEAGVLDRLEIKRIAEIIDNLNQKVEAAPPILPDRLLQISSMKETDYTVGRRKTYQPEWDGTWEFSKSDPITRESVSSALIDFLTQVKPGTPQAN